MRVFCVGKFILAPTKFFFTIKNTIEKEWQRTELKRITRKERKWVPSRALSREARGKYETCYVMISWISLKVFFSRWQVGDLIYDYSTNDAAAPKRVAPFARNSVFALLWYFLLRTFRDNQIAKWSTANLRLSTEFQRIYVPRTSWI